MVRITSKEAQAMKDAYSKMYAPKEEPKPETEATADNLLKRNQINKTYTREKNV